jgi:hypothetical protein
MRQSWGRFLAKRQLCDNPGIASQTRVGPALSIQDNHLKQKNFLLIHGFRSPDAKLPLSRKAGPPALSTLYFQHVIITFPQLKKFYLCFSAIFFIF